ncbi:MAG: aminopeptidase P family protein [Bacteroidales bacterium]|nr:aminopeptidase P family protein [Bacteroidales bacterium]
MNKLDSLRALMRSRDWDAVVLTGSDPHGSEYIPERYKQIRFLSGYGGEASGLVVTADEAGLWTDTRYLIEARHALEGSGITLHPQKRLGCEDLARWLGEQRDLTRIAVDALTTSAGFADALQQAVGEECEVVGVPELLAPLWPDCPELPQTPLFTVDSREGRRAKLDFLRDFCRTRHCDALLLGALDEVAWTLDVRASDIEYNPYVISYLLVSANEAVWYVLKDSVADPGSEDALERIAADGVRIEDYSAVLLLSEDLGGGGRLYCSPDSLNIALHEALHGAGVEMVAGESPVAAKKAVKTEDEIEALQRAHLLDGIAMEKFLFRLERELEAGRSVSEREAAILLGRLRGESEEYLSDSFETISAYGPSAALPHYVTPEEPAPRLRREGLYLCDSGGQYLCGTTDITRTVPLGACTLQEQEDYTLVLKGHIALASAVFPEGTPGCRIDALAREPLWKAHRNYGHGTGHGVGFLLGVHEGPQSIRQDLNPVALEPGMVVSCEPGIYREGQHGVRHENLLLCVQDGENDFGKWLRFETLTLCHFDVGALLPELLTQAEIRWLNAYQEKVFRTLSPYLSEEETRWLEKKTAALRD